MNVMAMIDKQELRRKAEAKKAEGFELVHNISCDDVLGLLDELEACKADAERMERNRDMWKEQCAKQSKQLEAMRVKPFNLFDTKGCLACGDDHYGNGGLPCPKMTPMALDGKDG